MVFLRSISGYDHGPLIRGALVYLRPPALVDFAAWSKLRAASRSFLTPWEPTWPRDDLTRHAFRARVKRYNREIREDLAYPYFLFSQDTDELLGGITISNIRRGVAQTGSLGYWIGEPFARHGYMGDAVRTIIAQAFGPLRLNRLEAACLQSNEPSIRLLQRCGFSREGLARGYLKINGRWQDHLLFAILCTDPRP